MSSRHGSQPVASGYRQLHKPGTVFCGEVSSLSTSAGPPTSLTSALLGKLNNIQIPITIETTAGSRQESSCVATLYLDFECYRNARAVQQEYTIYVCGLNNRIQSQAALQVSSSCSYNMKMINWCTEEVVNVPQVRTSTGFIRRTLYVPQTCKYMLIVIVSELDVQLRDQLTVHHVSVLRSSQLSWFDKVVTENQTRGGVLPFQRLALHYTYKHHLQQTLACRDHLQAAGVQLTTRRVPEKLTWTNATKYIDTTPFNSQAVGSVEGCATALFIQCYMAACTVDLVELLSKAIMRAFMQVPADWSCICIKHGQEAAPQLINKDQVELDGSLTLWRSGIIGRRDQAQSWCVFIDPPRSMPHATGESVLCEVAKYTVTVVVVLDNQAVCVAALVQSLQAQSYRLWRLLLVDYGSADETVEISRFYAAMDERITCISMPREVSIKQCYTKGISYITTGLFMLAPPEVYFMPDCVADFVDQLCSTSKMTKKMKTVAVAGCSRVLQARYDLPVREISGLVSSPVAQNAAIDYGVMGFLQEPNQHKLQKYFHATPDDAGMQLQHALEQYCSQYKIMDSCVSLSKYCSARLEYY